MKKLISFKTLLSVVLLSSTMSVYAAKSQIAYSADRLSGILEIRLADFQDTNKEYDWHFNLPSGQKIEVTRINSVYLYHPDCGVWITPNAVDTILNHYNKGTFIDTLENVTELHVILSQGRQLGNVQLSDPIITIRYMVIDDTHSASQASAFGGDVSIFNGVLNVSGSQPYLGSNVSAILGGEYNHYTCFGSPQGGRIRGSNEGYLVLEGNPNGYSDLKNVYINRYVAGNILMTSSTGKVGIGTDDPKEKLHLGGYIRGNAAGGALAIRTEFGTLTLGAQNNTTTLISSNHLDFTFDKSVKVEGNVSADTLTSAAVRANTLVTNGQVKCGTLRTPKIYAEDITVQVDAGADFVFEEGYDLQSLGDLQSYLETHKHLPGIQSAADMESNGVNVNQFQIQLLQKIEELTLYLIQQEQTIQELQKQIEGLTK